MNRLILSTATAALCLAPLALRGEGATGMTGLVMDATTKAPIPGVTVIVAREEKQPREKRELTTNREGFFSDLGLRPGNYIVAAELRGMVIACTVDDIHNGIVRRVKILVGRNGRDAQCIGPNVRHDTVDPDETASLYRVH